MRTIPYSSLERGLAAIAGIDSENLLAHEKAQFAEYINDASKYIWDYYPWPESVRVEERYFRPEYSRTTGFLTVDTQNQYYPLSDGNNTVTLLGRDVTEEWQNGTLRIPLSEYQRLEVRQSYRVRRTSPLTNILTLGRDSFTQEMTAYKSGDEVYHNGAYYRKWADDSQLTMNKWDDDTLEDPVWNTAGEWIINDSIDDYTVWHKIGDDFVAEEWEADAFYFAGALVERDGKYFLCHRNRVPTLQEYDAYNGKPPKWAYAVSLDMGGISLENSLHWYPVDPAFDRYIAYDQEGQEVIGTTLSVHAEDPRYSSSPPLDWKEGREGIYVELPYETNSLWVRFREEAPQYSGDTPDAPVLNYLAPAIKAYAYKAFLISDGQNEKSILQEQFGLDLLVREVDKLIHQQYRGGQLMVG